MVASRSGWVISTVLLGLGIIGPPSSEAWAQAKPNEAPALEGPVVGETSTPDAPGEPEAGAPAPPLHDAMRLSETRPNQERAPKSPPPPVAEQPSTERPEPQARWFGGYWSWDPGRDDFIWVSGAWRVPPADSIWVESRWRRDADGWYRVPGFWSPRQQNREVEAVADGEGWRVNGPPTDRPAEAPGPAPGSNYFYIPGQYVPDGERTTWKNGFWAQVQPGWDWVPARWTRQADGYQYREGYWTRDTGLGLSSPPRRHAVGRPSDLPATIVESEPDSSSRPPAGPDDPPATDPDVIADAERAAADSGPVVVVGPRGLYAPLRPPVVGYGYPYGMPYRMIRPPSPFYGPAGVVVPDAVPPFVQQLLNRVLP